MKNLKTREVMDAARKRKKGGKLMALLLAAAFSFGSLYLAFGQKKLEKSWSGHGHYCGHHDHD